MARATVCANEAFSCCRHDQTHTSKKTRSKDFDRKAREVKKSRKVRKEMQNGQFGAD
jgi:hypothetical protein